MSSCQMHDARRLVCCMVLWRIRCAQDVNAVMRANQSGQWPPVSMAKRALGSKEIWKLFKRPKVQWDGSRESEVQERGEREQVEV